MPPRLRKFIGTLVLIPLIVMYVILAGTIGDLVFREAAWPLQLAYFIIAGFAWVIPAGLFIRWMQKPVA